MAHQIDLSSIVAFFVKIFLTNMTSIMDRPIRVVALCVLQRGNSILVFEGFDSIKGTPFYRPLGGGVEPGETSKQACIREIREEIGTEVTDLKLLGTLENIFTLEGEFRHEVVFVYQGRFADGAAYAREEFTVTEDNGEVLKAKWRALSFFNDYHRLVPEQLKLLLNDE
jgi:8-oxo-dGTP pyrophosphatase MutT (NUDIX family)